MFLNSFTKIQVKHNSTWIPREGYVYIVDKEEVVIEPEPEKDGVYTVKSRIKKRLKNSFLKSCY